MAKMAPQ